MAAKDYLKPQVAVAVAVTAAISSPRLRKWARRGMVYGIAGALMAGDALSSAARSAARAAQEAAASAASEDEEDAQPTEGRPKAKRRRSKEGTDE